MDKHILIAEILSTGFNLVEDVLARGYQPVVVEATYPGTEEDRAQFVEAQRIARDRLPAGTPCIRSGQDYASVLEQVRAFEPVAVVAGSEFGVEIATHLASDLGLPGNPWSIIEQIFVFLGKVRSGGCVLVPESTYCHIPYGATGMDILLHAKGFRIEAPIAGKGKMIVASSC